jgi:chromate transporter
MLATLIGWKVAGWWGALVATLGLFVPSSILCYKIARVWSRYSGRRWHTAIEKGLAPIGAGLLLAGVISILRIADSGLLAIGLALASAAITTLVAGIHPLLLLAAGALTFVLVGI